MSSSVIIERPLAARLGAQINDYVQLTKPRIVLLFGITGMAAMVMAMQSQGSFRGEPLRLWSVLLGIILTAGSANAFNQYIDRDIDAVMERTRKKRPIPSGRMPAQNALIFALATGTLATWLLYHFGNALTAALGVGTIFFYIGIYTMWLKRNTPYNIVIGGAAGATAPLIGWAAATGSISLGAFLMFLIIFMWTPPHFWALALCVKDEYAGVSVPMLPVVKGEAETRKQILLYTLALIPLTFALWFTKDAGLLYLVGAVGLGLMFFRKVWDLYREKDEAASNKAAWRAFGYSIVYLLALFTILIADAMAAEKLPTELEQAGITEHLGAQIDLNLTFRNEQGELVPLHSVVDGRKPVLLFLAYYGCPNLCNFFLNGATEGMKKLQWTLGTEYKVVTISIDPRETPQLATKKKAAHIGLLGRPEVAPSWHFWVNDKPFDNVPLNPADDGSNVRKLANQVGFGYKWDKDQSQFAHSAAMIILTPEGKISRYLYGIEFQPKDLRLAIVEAGGRKIGTVMDHILLFCYNYDPKTRKYSLYATNLMRAGGGFTVLIFGGVLLGFWRRNRRGMNGPGMKI